MSAMRRTRACCCSRTARVTPPGRRRSRPWLRACARSGPDCAVALAYLELMQPDLPDGGGGAGRRPAARRVDVVPLFLGAGGHVRKTCRRCCSSCAAQHAGVRLVTLHAPIGEHPDVIEAMAARGARGTRLIRRHAHDMNLHQFRFVQEAVRRNLNLTETAKALYTSQPGISKAILELEEELGVDIFARHGKRLRRVTEPGQLVLKSIEIIMREVANLKRIGEEYSQAGRRHAVDRHHAHAGALLPARAGGRAAQALSRRCRWCCTRARRRRWRACCKTTRPRSAWPPSRSPTSTIWSRCRATSGST